MRVPKIISGLKPFAITYISVIAFSNFVFVLFSQTVRDIIWSFFKDAGGVVILGMVFLFALAWLIKARPHKIPKKYQIIILFLEDILLSKIVNIDGKIKTIQYGHIMYFVLQLIKISNNCHKNY